MVKGCGCDMKGKLMHYIEEREGGPPVDVGGAWIPYSPSLFRCGEADDYKEPDGTVGTTTRLCTRCMKKAGFLW